MTGQLRRHLPVLIASITIVLVALGFRLHGHDWDSGRYMQPDERYVVMVLTERIHSPFTWDLFSPSTSPLNSRSIDQNGEPRDFAYGSLPLLVTDALAWLLGALTGTNLNTYDNVGGLGRVLSSLVDTGTVGLSMLLAWRFFGRAAALIAGSLLATSVILIQLAHFFTVDSWVTFFSVAVIFSSLRYLEHGDQRWIAIAGASLGAALATKISVVTLVLPILVALVIRHWPIRSRSAFSYAFRPALIAAGAALTVFLVFEPYALWSPGPFIDDAITQWQIVRGKFDVPFTRQFIGLTPVKYELDNLLRWGIGPAFGLAALIGCGLSLRRARNGSRADLVLLAWLLPYFLVIAMTEAKYLRYSAPLVPILAIMVGAGAVQIVTAIPRTRLLRRIAFAAITLVVVLTTLWAIAFSQIYTQPHTRLTASEWIYENIPAGSTLTWEYWDDPLPLAITGHDWPTRVYQQIMMDLYRDRSSDEAFEYIANILADADYVILSSDRLSESIPRSPWRYPVQAEYYRLLDSGELGFSLVYESNVAPRLGGLTFDDTGADESFTVYDHPHVRIFAKERQLSRDEMRYAFAWSINQVSSPTREPLEPTLMLDQPVDLIQASNDLGWSSVVTQNSLAATLVWLVVLALIGVVTLPLTLWLFSSFSDLGWGLARALGLLTGGYLIWILVSLEITRFSAFSISGVLLMLAAVVWLVLRRQLPKIRQRLLESRRVVVASEICFLFGFGLFLLFRALNPDLWQSFYGGEKPMENAYISAIARSSSFPPYDPWFAHGSMNYYYYGFYLFSLVWKLTGIPQEIAFQLSVATLAGFVASIVFSLTSTVCRDWLKLRQPVAMIGAGIIGVVIHTLSGNLEVISQLIRGRFSTFDFWQSTRTIDFTITEFPFFTFLWADLHPHAIAIPISLLLLASLYALLRKDPENPQTVSFKGLQLGILALLLGSLSVTNSWDMPLAILLVGVAIVVAELITRKNPIQGLAYGGGTALCVGGVAWLMFQPFFASFVPFVSGVEVTPSGSDPGQFLLHFGGMFGILAFAAATFFVRDRNSLTINPWLPAAFGTAALPGIVIGLLVADGVPRAEGMALAALATGVAAILPFVVAPLCEEPLPRRAGIAITLVAVPIAAFFCIWRPAAAIAVLVLLGGMLLCLRSWPSGPGLFVGICLIAAGGITAGTEVVYVVDDLTGSPWFRMNTVFKFYVQAWTLLALASAVGFVWLFRQSSELRQASVLGLVATPKRGRRSQARADERRPSLYTRVTPFLFTLSAVLLILGLIYPILGAPARIATDMQSSPSGLTLDGLAWMHGASIQNIRGEIVDLSGDYEAINWLRENAEGNAVLLEASIGPYRGNGSRISAATGLPAVLGWDRHQRQQRYAPEINRRLLDVRRIYNSVDIELKRELLARYRVRYIVVGGIERAWRVESGFAGADEDGELYGRPAGLAAFESMVGTDLERVFASGNTVIYRVITPFERLSEQSAADAA